MKFKSINYYDTFIESAKFACDISEKLNECLIKTGEVSDGFEEGLHTIEHNADIHMHKVIEHLIKEFITPLDREDIFGILKNIDDITDSVESIANKLCMFNVKKIRPEAMPLFELIPMGCKATYEALVEFKNYKKSTILEKKIIEINDIEEKADRLYRKLMSDLFKNEKDTLEIIKWKEIYKAIEDLLDSCEDVADIIEEVRMKNI